jgi:poly-gamma-glutamate capsule biosynthesis protein CapA/YwtB (metallophosphatase superfamily)
LSTVVRGRARPRGNIAAAAAVAVIGLTAVAVAGCGGSRAGAGDGGSVIGSPAVVNTGAPDAAGIAGDGSDPGDPDAPVASPPDNTRQVSGVPITIAFGGDVHFEGELAGRLADPATALGPVASTLRSADLAFVNLETAVTTGGTPADKQYTFRAPPTVFTALRDAGVDGATMANNHGMDYGLAGLDDSLAAAHNADFPVVGIGFNEAQAFAPMLATVHGQRVAIIGATQVLDDNLAAAWTAGVGKPGLASAKNPARLLQAISDARRVSDTVIVYLHWGTEDQSCPTAAQTTLMHQVVAAGADIVVGSHAHVPLGGGWGDSGAYVDYGLGNFVFYASGDGPETSSGVLTLTVAGRAVTHAQWTPEHISAGIPLQLSGSAGTDALNTWNGLRACTGLASAPPARLPGRAGRG